MMPRPQSMKALPHGKKGMQGEAVSDLYGFVQARAGHGNHFDIALCQRCRSLEETGRKGRDYR